MSNEGVKGKLVDSNGSVLPRLEVDQTCSNCNSKLIYNERYDALFCASCNEWCEPACCNDPTCDCCGGRPPKPLLKSCV